MKTPNGMWAGAGLVALFCLASGRGRAETVYFLMSGPVPTLERSSVIAESYVVSVSEPALIQQARSYLAAGGGSPYLVPHVKIAPGAEAMNRNYAEPGRPIWPWHATELIEWTTYDPSLSVPAVILPHLHSWPSDVWKLLAGTEVTEPTREMNLIYFPVVMELSAGNKDAVVNLSTRGWVGTGERLLIAGFVVQGGAPRNVLIRAIGPSLSAFGVTEALADPDLTVYRGTNKVAENDDWLEGNFTRPPIYQTVVRELPLWYEWLFPTSLKEAAIRLSLPPGAYTVHVGGGGGTGVALVEVYDFDALAPAAEPQIVVLP